MRYHRRAVITFDDITDQLTDQRRAAWSDIARRIAHEIKNPLTPIQLAAERLQRRFGKEIDFGPGDVRAADRHDRPAGRRPSADGRRILQLRAHAEAGLPCGERPRDRAPGACSSTKSRIPGINFSLEPARGRRSRWSATAASSARRSATSSRMRSRRSKRSAKQGRAQPGRRPRRAQAPQRGRAAHHRGHGYRRGPAGRTRAADRALYDDARARAPVSASRSSRRSSRSIWARSHSSTARAAGRTCGSPSMRSAGRARNRASRGGAKQTPDGEEQGEGSDYGA